MPRANKRHKQCANERKNRALEKQDTAQADTRSNSSSHPMPSSALANHAHKTKSTPVVLSQCNTTCKSRSRSALKIVDIPDPVSPNTTGSPVMDLVQIQNLIMPLSCPHCQSSNLQLCTDEKSRKGLSILLKVSCGRCDQDVSQDFTSTRTKGNKSLFSINKSAVASSAVWLWTLHIQQTL
ncbi:hypothetical protein PoB_006869600 [Plakobranchus ocellatus]|uniref:Uncharacterized protein n=1 Tax=Plakobranchus ocellatus TaxID=259542 RepID=A0AAV4DDH3_9GAST|nr:hypothetical protein PoB_006869600 [Plakobranchus ocellatus]